MNLNDLPPRIARKVRVENDCWTWLGARNSRGYSSVSVAGRSALGHRYIYELLVGPIGPGLTIDHLCRNKQCLNPAHLEPVTLRENSRRKPVRDTCPKGHAMTGENLRIKHWSTGRTARECRACQIERQRASYATYHKTMPDRRPRHDRVDTDAFLAGGAA